MNIFFQMKTLVLMSTLLVFLCPRARAYAMTIKGGMYLDPKNPGKCTIDNNMILNAGVSIRNPHGECAILTCYKNGQVSMVTCLKPGMREGCTEGNVLFPNAIYPECCKREIRCKTHYYSLENQNTY